jgi:hypothetical protein
LKANGSVYVAVVFVVLIGYFSYQWWFNPSRVVKHRLGEIAAALSVPADESDTARLARLAQLRRYLANEIHITVGTRPEITSSDMALAVVGSWRPEQGSGDVHFADVQVFIESDTAAHAYLSVELTNLDRESGQSVIDARDASVDLNKRDGEWKVTKVESKDPAPLRP